MYLTEKELLVVNYLKDVLDESVDTIAYSEIQSALNIDSKTLRGVISSLLKKKVITLDYERDAKISFIGLR